MENSTTKWFYLSERSQVCQELERETIWGETICRVCIPENQAIIRVPLCKLKKLDDPSLESLYRVIFTAAAGKIADALSQDVLLAPLETPVIPLPHQLYALSRAIASDKVRYLLADEVGLGKTIEAGLIMRELKLRGLVKRTLVLAPKGLVSQWVSEMQVHFHEKFNFISSPEISAFNRIFDDQRSVWQAFDQIVCPIDTVKPLDSRSDWSNERTAEYNRDRFEALINAGWDLVVVDEAHRLGGSTDQVARFKLGQGLAEAAPYILLLSATPHQGKTDSFFRLMSLLDPLAFPDVTSINRERVAPFLIRTEKRRAIDAQGKPLFLSRQTFLIPVRWEDRHDGQKQLYEAISDYVREGYNQALREKKTYIGFLMVLMQRLVTSSTKAIRTALERRLENLKKPEENIRQLTLLSIEDWSDLDAQEQFEAFSQNTLQVLKNEIKEVEMLLALAKKTEASTPDAKAEILLEQLYRLQGECGEPSLKALIFTEFIPTQEMLKEFLEVRGFAVVTLNGSMNLEQRKKAQEEFAGSYQVLVSTDAGGEGLNLQFCHVVINFDLPWNPMRIEQRIGRVDRIGQRKNVQALNLLLEDSVEYRVREVLEEKLSVILKQFGVDKTSDVLDSSQADQLFDEVYVSAISSSTDWKTNLDMALLQVREAAQGQKRDSVLLSSVETLDPSNAEKILSHPMNSWVETMVVNHLRATGGEAEKQGRAWYLKWVSGNETPKAVFSFADAETLPMAEFLTVEDPRIRGLIANLPRFAPGQTISHIRLSDLSSEISGIWSLWKVTLQASNWSKQRIFPLFLHDDNRILSPSAHVIWSRLLEKELVIDGGTKGNEALDTLRKLSEIAENFGKDTFHELHTQYQQHLMRERNRMEFSIASRKRGIERIGLPQVKAFRLAQLMKEEKDWKDEFQKRENALPELTPLLVLRVGGKAK